MWSVDVKRRRGAGLVFVGQGTSRLGMGPRRIIYVSGTEIHQPKHPGPDPPSRATDIAGIFHPEPFLRPSGASPHGPTRIRTGI